MTTVEFKIKGEEDNEINAIIDFMDDNYGDKISIIKTLSKSFAWESLVISVVGSITGTFATILWNELKKYKKKKAEHYKITIIDETSNLTFILPENSDKFIKHYRRVEIEKTKYD